MMKATGQHYLRARFYNPVIGRFLREDVYRGDGLNLYAYCANNLVMYYDPSGYMGLCPKGKNAYGYVWDENVEIKLPLNVQKKSAYNEARAKGLTASESYMISTGKNPLNQVGKDYMAMREQHKIMDIYQQYATNNFKNRMGSGSSRRIGIWTHDDVKHDMTNYWLSNHGDYPYIRDVSIENIYIYIYEWLIRYL